MSAATKSRTYAPAPFDAAKPTATALLIIDLDALCDNYRTLFDMAEDATCAAVIKANAYGTGAAKAATALSAAGCHTFFVATFEEALVVRKAVPSASVYVLDGLFPGACKDYVAQNIRPVLSSIEDAAEWAEFCVAQNEQHPAALHVDTGMNRLGLGHNETLSFREDTLQPAGLAPALLMSHLACADTPDDPKNAQQLERFREIRATFPDCPASLANSGGIMLGPDFHFDMVRAGVALYGAEAVTGKPPLAPVVQLHARISQLHEAEAGETVGYGASQPLERKTRIATVCAGYADGIFRRLGSGKPESSLVAHIGNHPAPVLGRVSMDLVTLDVTDVPEDMVHRGGWAEIIGPNTSLDDLARRAGTIGYEVLTNLSRRAQRIYLGNTGEAS